MNLVSRSVTKWLVVAAIASGVGCDSDTTLAETSYWSRMTGGPKAEIVWVTKRWLGLGGASHVIWPEIKRKTHAELRIGDKVAHLPGTWTDATNVELVVDDEGHRLAYRKEGGWRPVWIGEQRLLLGSNSQVQGDSAIDWGKVPSLVDAAPTLCRESPAQGNAVMEEIETLGADSLAGLLVATVEVQIGRRGKDAWERGFAKLDGPARATVVDELRAAVVGSGPAVVALARFARNAQIQSDAEREAALDAVAKVDWVRDISVVRALIAQGSLHAAEPTAEWACRHLRSDEPEPVLWALAAGRHQCEAASAFIAEVDPCRHEWRCSPGLDRHLRPLCNPETIAGPINEALEHYAGFGHPKISDDLRSRVAAAVMGDQIPENVRLANMRRLYPKD